MTLNKNSVWIGAKTLLDCCAEHCFTWEKEKYKQIKKTVLNSEMSPRSVTSMKKPEVKAVCMKHKKIIQRRKNSSQSTEQMKALKNKQAKLKPWVVAHKTWKTEGTFF